jgi:hypothetical protein
MPKQMKAYWVMELVLERLGTIKNIINKINDLYSLIALEDYKVRFI